MVAEAEAGGSLRSEIQASLGYKVRFRKAKQNNKSIKLEVGGDKSKPEGWGGGTIESAPRT